MQISREEMATALISLGYEINRSWQFALRNDERTPSARINNDGSVHDFGSGFHGDLIQVLIEYHSMDFKKAKQEAYKLLGLETKVDFTSFDTSSGELDERPLPDSFVLQYEKDRKKYFDEYKKELKLLFMGEYDGKQMSCAPWNSIEKMAKKYKIGYAKKSGRLIMPIRDIDSKIRTFWKYKKYGDDFTTKSGKVLKHRKVLYTKNKSRPPFAITDLVEFRKVPDEPIVITEGEKDALVANANGLRAICIGGAGASKNINEKYLHLFSDLNIIIAGDYDTAGMEFNKNLLEQLKPIAKSVTILNWEQKANKDVFKLHDKFDLADYFAWKNNR